MNIVGVAKTDIFSTCVFNNIVGVASFFQALPRNLWVTLGGKNVAHPVPNLLRDKWSNTDPGPRGRQDAGQEYSQ